ncbi:MAG TPA: hypothetical protein VEQ60_23045 [Longimicrobium sp.]|nr:hypothetical protein [Longimicrobium sp.]
MGEERSIPSPPAPRGSETSIIDEIPTTAGLVLWLDVRHIRDWAQAPFDIRGALFPSPVKRHVLMLREHARAERGEIADALVAFEDLLTNPTEADPRVLAQACAEVAGWAAANSLVQTAIEYAETAALVDPISPALANLAGRTTRNASEFGRAEIWFRRGIGYARLQDDKVELARGHLGRGILYQEIGKLGSAKKHMHAGARVAREKGLDWLAAEAQHDLMLLLAVHGQYHEAEKHANFAVKWYGSRHPRFPLFAADVALLMVLQAQYRSAARLARGALRHVREPSARSVILALLARALVGAGLGDELDRLRRRVLALVRSHGDREAVALWHLAAAEHAARRWRDAGAHATRALELASEQSDRETARLSSRLLAAIRAKKPAPQVAASRGPELADLVEAVSSRLSNWTPERRALSPVRAAWVA